MGKAAIRKVILIIIGILILSNARCYADNAVSPWQFVFKSDYGVKYYVNTQSYKSYPMQLTYWEKVEKPEQPTEYNQYKVNFEDLSGYRILHKVDGRTYDDETPLYVHPGDPYEKEINVLREKRRLPLVFGTKEHQWQYVGVMGENTYYICKDIYEFSSYRNTLKVYAYWTDKKGRKSSVVKYTFHNIGENFKPYLKEPDGTRWYFEGPIPYTVDRGTREEMILNAAKKLFLK